MKLKRDRPASGLAQEALPHRPRHRSGAGKTGGRAARARPRAPACASRALKAARCRSIAACPSAASRIRHSS